MDLNEVAVFIKVVQMGSFSKAGQQLDMPNSTVSSKISSLEKRLGITLIQRTTRKLNITPAGQAYYKRCLMGLEEINAAEAEIAAVQGEPQGLLRITAPSELSGTVLPKLIATYTNLYPKARVELIITDRHMDLLSENVDLAIRGGLLHDSSLIAKKISSGNFMLFAAPKYIKNNPGLNHPRDLPKHLCLQLTALGTTEWKLTGPKGPVTVPLSGRVLINDLNTIKSLALAGHGVAALPTEVTKSEERNGKLVRVLPDWKGRQTHLNFVYPAQKFVSPKLSAFISMASDIFKESFADFEI